MARRLHPEQIEFGVGDPSPAVAALRGLLESGGGWMNLFPEVEEDDVAAVTPSALGAMFRASGPPIPQATFMAPKDGRRGRVPLQLGLSHGVGTRVLPRLAAEGIERPADWKVVQDHVRRGVVLSVPDPVDPEAIVVWSLRAAQAMCPVPVTGAWLAEVHRP